MKKIYLFIFLLVFTNTGWSQNSFLRDNEFTINPYVISPSYSGFNTNHEIFASYINHFTGVKGSPNSVWVNYNGIVKKNLGIGTSIRYEKFGAFRNIRADISTAYHLKIANDHKLSIGLGISITQTSIDFSNSNADPINDATLNSFETTSGIGFNASFGVTYAWKKLNISVSAPGLVPLKKGGKLFLYSQPIQLRIYAAYDIAINRQWSVKPQFVMDYVLKSPINFNAVVGIKYNNMLWINLGYGAQSIISTGLGTLISQRFTIQYTFRYGLNGIAKSPFGSHEICLGVTVGKLKPAPINNSIFLKNSKSPYHEWE